MKRTTSHQSPRGRVSRSLIFGLSGWVVALALVVIAAPRLWPKIAGRISALQTEANAMARKARAFEITSTRWKDSRPLHVLVGDSHIQMGDWYELCSGAHAVRNCGISGSTIAELTSLVASIPEKQVDTLVLLAGINDLGKGLTVKECVEAYRGLVKAGREALKPRRIVVISVFPVRQSAMHPDSRTLNRKVEELNGQLKQLCSEEQISFTELNRVLTDSDGSLAADLTLDGLHLNAKGYQVAALVLCEQLGQK